jgi:hypothetical protein
MRIAENEQMPDRLVSRCNQVTLQKCHQGQSGHHPVAAADRGQYRQPTYFTTLRISRDNRSGAVMARPRIHFNCPHCNALYQIVRTEADPETTTEREVTCQACAGPLPPRHGQSGGRNRRSRVLAILLADGLASGGRSL